MRTIWQDLRFALRLLGRNPYFSLTCVAILAVGIGANSAIFTLVNSVLIRPLPYQDSEGLVAIFEHDERRDRRRNPTSPANFRDWKEQNQVVESMTAAHPWSPVLQGREHPVQLQGLRASPSLFQLLGAEALLGRVFLPEDERTLGDQAVVLGHDLWQRQFGGDRSLLGGTIRMDGQEFTVLGVMPPGFRFPPFWAEEAELWAPRLFTPQEWSNRGARFLRVFARLLPGVSIDQAHQEMARLGEALKERFPRRNKEIGIHLEALQEPVISAVRPALLALSVAVGFILLICSANLAGLLLARASRRRREIAIRLSLGAGRRRLFSQLLTESLLLALLGGAAGLLMGYWGLQALMAAGPQDFPRLAEVGLDNRVLLFTLAITLMTGTAFGLAPAWQTLRSDLRDALQQGGRGIGSGQPRRLRSVLVTGQMALALALLAGSGLALSSYWRLSSLDPGFRRDSLLTLTISLAGSSNQSLEQQHLLFESIRQQTSALPGVSRTALINHLPIGGDIWGTGLSRQGQPPDQDRVSASLRTATPGYFETMGISRLQGRDFSEQDSSASQPVVIINRLLARQLWPGQQAVGKRLKQGQPGSNSPWRTVVGVVADVRQWDLSEAIRPEVYFPYSQNPVSWYQQTSLVAEAEGSDPRSQARAISDRIWNIDGSLALSQVRSMSGILHNSVRQPRFQSLLLGIFSSAALLLAAVGLYGLVSYSVSQRTHETGVRMALGARPSDIIRLIVGEGMRFGLWGAGLGLALTLLLTSWLESLLFEISPYDPWVLTAATAILLASVLAACLLPARRAVRADPLQALRSE